MFGNLSRVSCCFRHLDTRRRPISWDLFPPSRGPRPRQSRHRSHCILIIAATATDLLHYKSTCSPRYAAAHTCQCRLQYCSRRLPIVFLISRSSPLRLCSIISAHKICYHGLRILIFELSPKLYIMDSVSSKTTSSINNKKKRWPHIIIFFWTSWIHNLSNKDYKFRSTNKKIWGYSSTLTLDQFHKTWGAVLFHVLTNAPLICFRSSEFHGQVDEMIGQLK